MIIVQNLFPATVSVPRPQESIVRMDALYTAPVHFSRATAGSAGKFAYS